MAPNPARTDRDPRIDLLRGLALFAIFINHIPGNPARFLTWGWLGFSDAAELFMLLAGLSLALAYGGFQARNGWPALAARLGARAFRLYRTYLLLALALAAAGATVFAATGNRAVLWHLGIGPLLGDTVAALPALFALCYLPGYADILATYVPLVLASALLLPLAGVHPLLVLVPSGLVWAGVQATGANLPAGFDGERWMFNPLAWQFLFCIGLVIGMGRRRGWSWPRHGLLDGAAIAWVLAGLLALAPWRQAGLDLGLPLEAAIPLGAKDGLGWQRLLHILALAHLVQRLVPRRAGWLSHRLLAPLALAGRQPLPVFVAGSLLSFAGYCLLVLGGPDASWLRVLLVNGGGILCLTGVAAAIEWQARGAPLPAAGDYRRLFPPWRPAAPEQSLP